MTINFAAKSASYRDIATVDYPSLKALWLEEPSNPYSFRGTAGNPFKYQFQFISSFEKNRFSAPPSIEGREDGASLVQPFASLSARGSVSKSLSAKSLPTMSDIAPQIADGDEISLSMTTESDSVNPYGSASLAPGSTFLLSGGETDICYGTTRDDTFILGEIGYLGIDPDDVLVGGAGTDTLLVNHSGQNSIYLAILWAARFEGIERIVFQDDRDSVLAVGVESFRDVDYVQFGAGTRDEIVFEGGVFDLTQKTIVGAEIFYLKNSAITVDDKDLAMLASADSRDEFYNGVTLLNGTFTAEERHTLFGRGISSITDDNGTYTNRAPTLSGFAQDTILAVKGQPVFLDPAGSAVLNDDGLMGSLSIHFWQGSAGYGSFGISSERGGVALPTGVVVGGVVQVGGLEIGTIIQDGTTSEGLVIQFNENATASRVETLLHALTYTSTDTSIRSLNYQLGITDIYGLGAGRKGSIKVSDPEFDPKLYVTAKEYSILDTETVNLFPDATVIEPNGEKVTLTIRLDVPENGVLTGFSRGIYSAKSGLYYVSGTVEEVQALLRSIVFVPRDRADPGAIETTKFTISVADPSGFPVVNSTVTVSARDGVGNTAPTDVILSDTTVKEFAANTSGVGVLSVTDPDIGDSATFEFATVNGVLQDGDGRFAIERVNGEWLVVVKDGIRLDFEQQRTIDVVVKAIDLGGASIEKTITIAVRNVGVEIVNGSAGNDLIKAGSGNDQLKGNAGNDTLHGGGGKDALTGGEGNDVFVFDTTPNARTNVDTITDFNINEDKIYFENSVFIRLTRDGTPANPVELSASAFYAAADATAGTTADHRVVYNTTTGALYYDPDGSGSQAAIQIAVLTGKPALTAAQLFVI